ncbi:MAG: recombination mediator RecR [Alphaproteobacteria bacterium]|nr:recombination mediator RecR [Alphaproteobacteria bacterium]
MHGQNIGQLIDLFARLPGLGPRSARRLVLHLIKKRESHLVPLAKTLQKAIESIKHCNICGNLDGCDPCQICVNPNRDRHVLCVVEDVTDLWAIERSGAYLGLYHVLGGALSALDGIGPSDLSIPALLKRVQGIEIQEILLATNATMEGQTTSHYIAECLKESKPISRLAFGIPMGSELDYLDEGTLAAAIRTRQKAA